MRRPTAAELGPELVELEAGAVVLEEGAEVLRAELSDTMNLAASAARDEAGEATMRVFQFEMMSRRNIDHLLSLGRAARISLATEANPPLRMSDKILSRFAGRLSGEGVGKTDTAELETKAGGVQSAPPGRVRTAVISGTVNGASCRENVFVAAAASPSAVEVNAGGSPDNAFIKKNYRSSSLEK